jgi:hypothetical protein
MVTPRNTPLDASDHLAPSAEVASFSEMINLLKHEFIVKGLLPPCGWVIITSSCKLCPSDSCLLPDLFYCMVATTKLQVYYRFMSLKNWSQNVEVLVNSGFQLLQLLPLMSFYALWAGQP